MSFRFFTWLYDKTRALRPKGQDCIYFLSYAAENSLFIPSSLI